MLTLLVIYGLADDTFAKALIHGEWPAQQQGSAEAEVERGADPLGPS